MNATQEPTRRLFFALWPEEPMQAALARAGRSALESCGGRSVPVQNLHLTLAFLGSVRTSRIAELTPIASGVAGAAWSAGARVSVTLDRLELWKKAQLLCATASEIPDAVMILVNELRNALLASGFAPDLKPFRPHVTLARKVQRVSHEPALLPTVWSFGNFRLVESRSDPGGSIYSSRGVW